MSIIKGDKDLIKVLKDDGIQKADLFSYVNQTITDLEKIKKDMGTPPWSVRIVYNNYISAVMIAQNPGEGNRWHYHDDCDEFWIMLEGSMKWIIDGENEIIANEKNIIYVKRMVKHKMLSIGDKPSIRLSISVPDVNHFYIPKN